MPTVNDNLDDFFKELVNLEKSVDTEIVREARKRMRATVRSEIPKYKRLTPESEGRETSGRMRRSLKVRSRSRRGKSIVSLVWLVPYAGFVNFKKNTKSEKFATNQYNSDKEMLEKKGADDVTRAFREVLERKGYTVK